MYADSNIVHEPVTDFPERISGLQELLKGAPPLPERKLWWHCALEMLELTDKLASVSGERTEVASLPRKGLCSKHRNM
jgi:hypothetical protein